MKKKKISLTKKKLTLDKTTLGSLNEQKPHSGGKVSYHTFIGCDEDARRNGYFC
ncbi:hypothetical protein [Chitinophaga vietnamensis]|uniref:hypothetical protein n=1 Tax=Chitinophaga vietnamensis TaxID=2593957 RepID=UPI001375AB1A|nr:hypothetical protein [Chitinophaga vietnamensis]